MEGERAAAGTDVPRMGTHVPILGTKLPGSQVSEALFGRVRGVVLALFLTRPETALYVREVISLAGVGQGAVQRELLRLTEAGILIRERRGRQVFYRANTEAPVYPELRGLIVKTVGLVDVLRAALAPVSERIAVAFVFGSFARGTANGQSDVDVMIIGEIGFAEAVAALAPAEETLGREVNPSVYPASEFRQRLAAGQHFLTAVLREPRLYLVGDSDALGRVAGEGLADGAPDQ